VWPRPTPRPRPRPMRNLVLSLSMNCLCDTSTGMGFTVCDGVVDDDGQDCARCWGPACDDPRNSFSGFRHRRFGLCLGSNPLTADGVLRSTWICADCQFFRHSLQPWNGTCFCINCHKILRLVWVVNQLPVPLEVRKRIFNLIFRQVGWESNEQLPY
jgi:hypothetical protein